MSQNIIITGMPWSWKSTIWSKVAYWIWYNFCDFDDDVLEKITEQIAEEIIWVLKLRSCWIKPEDLANQEVKDLLRLLWDDDFLELESYMWENLNFKEETVLSTSGSLPLKIKAIDHLKKSWEVIYIDTDIKDIIKRLKEMKVDRIVWMWKMTLEEILEYRKEFYDKTKDFSFTPPNIDKHISKKIQKMTIVNNFIKFLKENSIWK